MRKLFLGLASAALIGIGAQAAHADHMDVRVCTEGAYPPFNWIDENGDLQGFDVDITRALCDAGHMNCEFVVVDWDGIIPALEAKKCDAIIASMSITEERDQRVDFTDKYYSTPAKFIKSKDMEIEIPSDVAMANEKLAGKVIGVQRATIHENFVRDNFPDAEIKAYATQDEVNLDLANGRVDLVLADSVALDEGFLQTDEGQGFEFVGPDYTDPQWFGEGAGIAVREGDADLQAAFNASLAQILEDGTYAEINDKYFDFNVYGN